MKATEEFVDALRKLDGALQGAGGALKVEATAEVRPGDVALNRDPESLEQTIYVNPDDLALILGILGRDGGTPLAEDQIVKTGR